MPEALFNFLALLGWSPQPTTGPDGEQVFREKMPLDELIAEFDFERVSKSPAQFDRVKLGAMNYDYIVDRLNSRPAELIAHLKADVKAAFAITGDDTLTDEQAIELALWTAVGRTILNLDEFVTRN